MTKERVSREELYEQVWTTPLLRLAVEYGVSNVALGKTCRRLNIPTPNRGYWARVAAGEKPKRPPLPKSAPSAAGVRLVRDRAASAPAVAREAPSVTVSGNLSDIHEVARKLAARLNRAPVDEFGRMNVGDMFTVTVDVHRRALFVLSALCKGLEARGHSVSIHAGPNNAETIQALIGLDTVSFSLSECTERFPHEPTIEERASIGRGEASKVPRYDYRSSGRLRLDVHAKRLTQHVWSDSQKGPLERALGRVLTAIEAAANDRRIRREAEDERRRAEEEQKRLVAEEQARLRRLERLADYRALLNREMELIACEWAVSRRLRGFLDAWEIAVPPAERDATASEWLESGRAHAARLDPLMRAKTLPKELEPSDEALERALALLRSQRQVG